MGHARNVSQTKEYRLRRAMHSLVEASVRRGDPAALVAALRTVYPIEAARVVSAFANSEQVAGQMLSADYSSVTEFSVLDEILLGDREQAVRQVELLVANLEKLSARFGEPQR